jgi:hypothetical protein
MWFWKVHFMCRIWECQPAIHESKNPLARPLMVVSSSVLLIPSVAFIVPVVVAAPSLWLMLSKGGKEALGSYAARANG